MSDGGLHFLIGTNEVQVSPICSMHPVQPFDSLGTLICINFPDCWKKWAVRHSCSWFKSNRKLVIYTAWYSAGCVLPRSLVVAPLHCHSFAFVPVETDWGRTVNIIALRFILLYFYFLCVYVYVCVSHECTRAPGDRGCWIPWIWRYAVVSCPCDCCEPNSGLLPE